MIGLNELSNCKSIDCTALAAANNVYCHSSDGDFVFFPELCYLSLHSIKKDALPCDVDPRDIASGIIHGLFNHASKLQKHMLLRAESLLSKHYPVKKATCDL